MLSNNLKLSSLALLGGPKASTGPTPSLLALDGTTAWFTDPRAVISGGALFFSTVSGTTTNGNIELHRLQNGVRDTFLLCGEHSVDDHNNASILVLSSGKLAVFYSSHSDTATRVKVSLAAAPNIGGFGPEMLIPATSTKSTSYSHPFLLSDGNIYLFRRDNLDTTAGRQQQLCVDSESAVVAGTATFATKTSILTNTTVTSQRPYAKYVQNAVDRIDCFTTNGHPSEMTGVGVYHMYMKLVGGVLKYFQSDGTEIVAAKPFDVVTSLTPIQTTATDIGEHWTFDIRIGADGFPRCLSTGYPTNATTTVTNIEYWHHRWTGSAWVNTRLSQNNVSLFAAQQHYAPGLCFDGNDTSIIYMAENDAGTGIAEIKKYSFNEGTATLSAGTVITSASTNHNIRPYSPAGHDATNALLWATAASAPYSDYTNYEMNCYVLGAVAARLSNPTSYEAETTALLARMSVQPTTTRKNVIDRRIKKLKAAPYSGSNLWGKIAANYIFQAHDAQAMQLNWKAASNDLTVTGTPTQTVNQGLKGDAGGTAYLLGPAPNAVGAPFSQSDAHISHFYGKTTNALGSSMRRVTGGPPIFMRTSGQGVQDLLRLNTTVGFLTSQASAGDTVHEAVSRTGASAVNVYRDGGAIGSNTDASGALDSAALAFGYLNDSGFIRSVSLGSSLTPSEAADLFFLDYEYSRDARS
jgi:hypothetical protein